jgi:hypothetical protein
MVTLPALGILRQKRHRYGCARSSSVGAAMPTTCAHARTHSATRLRRAAELPASSSAGTRLVDARVHGGRQAADGSSLRAPFSTGALVRDTARGLRTLPAASGPSNNTTSALPFSASWCVSALICARVEERG